jgi:hypothetical protein
MTQMRIDCESFSSCFGAQRRLEKTAGESEQADSVPALIKLLKTGDAKH